MTAVDWTKTIMIAAELVAVSTLTIYVLLIAYINIRFAYLCRKLKVRWDRLLDLRAEIADLELEKSHYIRLLAELKVGRVPG